MGFLQFLCLIPRLTGTGELQAQEDPRDNLKRKEVKKKNEDSHQSESRVSGYSLESYDL